MMRSLLVILFLTTCICYSAFSQSAQQKRVDSIKAVLQKKYDEMAIAFDKRSVDTMLSYRTKDFRILGPSGELQDYPMGVDNARYFVTNNIPPYHIKNTIQSIRISPNNLVAIVDVRQESVRKRELGGKLRDVKVMVDQTETWVYQDNKWLIQMVQNIRNRKRYVDGKRVSDNPNAPYNPDAPEYVDPSEQIRMGIRKSLPTDKKPNNETLYKKFHAEFDKMTAAFTKDDMLGVASFYADDAVIVSGEMEVYGRKAIDDYWLSIKGLGKSWELKTVSIEGDENTVLHEGISTLVMIQNGIESTSKGKFLVVWKKRDGNWKIIKDYYTPF